MLTARGLLSEPVIVALLAFGNKHFSAQGRACCWWTPAPSRAADPVLVTTTSSGQPIEEPDYVYAAGPAAAERTRRKFAPADGEQESVARMERKRNPGRPLPHSAALHAGYKRRTTK